MTGSHRTLLVAAACAAFALATLLIWIPADVDSSVIQLVRRRASIGDAMAPAVAAVILLLGAVVLVFERQREATPGLPRESLVFLGLTVLIIALSFVLMRWTGPMLTVLAGLDYRPLRASAPWKYLGFGLGGFVLVAGLVALAERRFSWRGTLVAALVVLGLIAVYDLPFDDLLLPPNGDF